MITQSPVKEWRNQKKITSHLGKSGKIISFTIIRIPPSGFESQAPYAVALAAFGKERLIGQLANCNLDKIKIGNKVKTILRRVKEPSKEGLIPYGVKFQLL